MALTQAHESDDQAGRERLLEQVVRAHMPVARAIAHRYRQRGLATDDLEQVAYVALVYAVRHFDPHRGFDFLGYLVPTVRGALKRQFRDFAWTIRPPRRVQELHAEVATETEALVHRLGRVPSLSDVAVRLDVSVGDVSDALAAHAYFTPLSLDVAVTADSDVPLSALVPEDPDRARAASRAEARIILGPVVRQLGARDRHILQLRFVEDWTQTEIAEHLGVSQNQVSRLLKRILRDLRVIVTGAAA